MIVKYKPTGQYGEIPDNKFDPNLFEQVNTGQQASMPATQQAPAKQDTGLIASLLSPFVKTGKMIGAGGFEGVRAILSALGNKNVYVDENNNPVQNPFKTQEELQQLSSREGTGTFNLRNLLDSKALGGIYQQGVKPAAGVASWAVPFGKGSNLITKTLLPGMAAGGLSAMSDEESNPSSILEGGVYGGAGALALGALFGVGGKVLSKLGKTESKLGEGVREGVRQIRQPASVYGSGKEKAINKTLNELGIKGTPTQQYAQLEPKMYQLEKEIQNVIKQNPDVVVTKTGIKESFFQNLKSALRAKDLTNAQAISEVKGYMDDLIKASGGTGKFTNISLERLRILKKLVNEDYPPVHKILQNGGALTPRQKVIEVAWESLDNAVKNASPEMKRLLTQESNLFKAAPSLSAARNNPPTLRAFGTSIPGGVTNTGQDLLGRLLGTTGGVSTKAGGGMSSVSQSPLLQMLGAKGGATLSNSVTKQTQNENNYPQNNGSQYNTQGNVNDHTNMIPQTGMQQPKSVFTKEKLTLAILADPKNQSTYETLYKYLNPDEAKTGAALTKIQEVTVKGGIRNLEQIKQKFGVYDRGGNLVGMDVNKMKKSTLTGGVIDPAYRSMAEKVVMAILRPESGAAIPPEELDRYVEAYLPTWKDSQESALYKIQDLEAKFADYGF